MKVPGPNLLLFQNMYGGIIFGDDFDFRKKGPPRTKILHDKISLKQFKSSILKIILIIPIE